MKKHRQSRFQSTVEHIVDNAGEDGIDAQECRIILKHLTGHLMKPNTMTSLLDKLAKFGRVHIAAARRVPYYANSNYRKNVYVSKYYE